MSSTKSSAGTAAVIATSTCTLAAALITARWYKERRHIRHERTKWIEEEKHKQEDDELNETLPGIIDHFRDLQLDYDSTIELANKRRTTKYYEMARDAHKYDICLGVRSYPRLRNRRQTEMERALKYYNEGTKSHRTVIVMCDSVTSQILNRARSDILAPLEYSHDITTTGVWIPELSIIPEEDLHVTVAIPWWWHTIREGNRELSIELAARFRQAVTAEFHHAFQIELERIVLIGGKALVALWRCVGERKGEDNYVIYDRHGEETDQFVRLRRDIVRCFTSTDSFEAYGKEPLTYATRYPSTDGGELPPLKVADKRGGRPKLERQNTIELKTPGLGDHDGFIHTTLARLPLNCLSMKDVELEPIHRLCREATAAYCGHRMVVSKFRFVETVGAGGESNPCINPIFDETIEAPPRFEMTTGGALRQNTAFSKTVERNATIGAPPAISTFSPIDGLFQPAVEEATKSSSSSSNSSRRSRSSSFGSFSNNPAAAINTATAPQNGGEILITVSNS